MIPTPQLAAAALAAIAVVIAVRSDLVSRRVPNALTLPVLVVAPLLAAFAGMHAALVACAIIAGALVLGTFVHALGVLGGGDVKLLAGVSALAGFPSCVDVALYTALCGGILALVVSATRGELGAVVTRLRNGAFGAVAGGSLAAGAATIDRGGIRLPYALAIGAGYVLATVGATVLPALRIVQ